VKSVISTVLCVKLTAMNSGQNHCAASASIMALAFSLIAVKATGECVVSHPLRVNQICGQLLLNGYGLPGILRLTRREKAGTMHFEVTIKTDNEGQFHFKSLRSGKYELRVTPVGAHEVFVPILVDVGHPSGSDACKLPLDLKLDFLPEPCFSPELRKAAAQQTK
jgi:hypothetical protein